MVYVTSVAEKEPPANIRLPTDPETAGQRRWGDGHQKSCWRTQTRYVEGRVVQQSVACKQLDCPSCGPRKRQADHEKARSLFDAEEGPIYAIHVPSWRVDHLRKQAHRRDCPTYSVPVSEEENVVFSTYQFPSAITVQRAFKAAESADEEFVRRVFLEERVSRRHTTSTGKWERKRLVAKPRGVTLSRDFIGRQAFLNVADRHSKLVSGRFSEEGAFFHDNEELGAEYWKRLLMSEEHRLRKESRRQRGLVPTWGGLPSRARAAA